MKIILIEIKLEKSEQRLEKSALSFVLTENPIALLARVNED